MSGDSDSQMRNGMNATVAPTVLDIPDQVWIEHVFPQLDVCSAVRLLGTCCALRVMLQDQFAWKMMAMGTHAASTYSSGYTSFVTPLTTTANAGAGGAGMGPSAGIAENKTANWREVVKRSAQRLLTGGGSMRFREEIQIDEAAGSSSEHARLHQHGLGTSDGKLRSPHVDALVAGHSPHMLWLEGTRVIAFAGNFYPNPQGGATPHPLPSIFELDVSATPVRVIKHIRYEQDPITGTWPHGRPHPRIMGAASVVWKNKVVFFGGGSPIDTSTLNNHVTSFDIDTEQWETLWEPPSSSSATPTTDARNPVGASHPTPEGVNVDAAPVSCLGPYPGPRQGLGHGVVWENRFYIFGGRQAPNLHRDDDDDDDDDEASGCLNDVWSFHLIERTWRQERPSGEAPTPRVWYAAVGAMNGKLLVCGGSLWNFKEVSEDVETGYRRLYCLDVPAMKWELIDDVGDADSVCGNNGAIGSVGGADGSMGAGGGGGSRHGDSSDTATAELPTRASSSSSLSISSSSHLPPWVTGGRLVTTGREILYFGGTKPHKLGPSGLTDTRHWKEWYSNLGSDCFVFDTKTRRWTALTHNATWQSEVMGDDHGNSFDLEISCGVDLWRSHHAACFVPTTNQIFVFGGSRYFTGEYFHDLLAIDLASSRFRTKKDPNPASKNWPGGAWYPYRGMIGRLHGMVRAGMVPSVDMFGVALAPSATVDADSDNDSAAQIGGGDDGGDDDDESNHE